MLDGKAQTFLRCKGTTECISLELYVQLLLIHLALLMS